jgi:dihydropteroate synthase
MRPMTSHILQCGRYRFDVRASNGMPLVMGILNLTPDSFSDGGRFNTLEGALWRAEQMIADGVDIIDIGGESTRPGAPSLPVEEELRRIMPALYALRDCGKPISVDTRKPEVMSEALGAGADMINDIGGFRAEKAMAAVKSSDCALCIMHMLGDPQTMQQAPAYADVAAEVAGFLAARAAALEAQGVARERMCIDPGFGFGKTLAHNLTLLASLGRLRDETGLPVLAGLSRKSMIGALTGRPVESRLAGSVAAALAAASNGARILRVHDVAETVDALKVWKAAGGKYNSESNT